MNCPRSVSRSAGLWSTTRNLFLGSLVCLSLSVGVGCTTTTEQKVVKPRFPQIAPDANLPEFMQGTVQERAVLGNTEPYNVSNYGLVGQLRGTGDTTASNVVRQYMVKEMARRGFGDSLVPGFGSVNPGDVLRDSNYAIARVDAFIPPGARKDSFIDATVTCLPNNRTTSLARGMLFETDLKDGGADVDNPAGAVNAFVRVKGAIVVNPAYVLENPETASPQAKASLRNGTVMFNARVMRDRPLTLQLRTPQYSMSRALEKLIDYRFQDDSVAKAQNDGIIDLYVPHGYHGDWQRFGELVRHLYVRTDADFNSRKARQLAEAAVQPGARLEDISYCWEGIGAHALPHVLPLLNHSDQNVAYYAARAAAFIKDQTGAAEERLMQMARLPSHPYRLTAVRTLGSLPRSHSRNSLMRELLESDEAQVRIEAYHILARNEDSAVKSIAVAPVNDPTNQKFMLDVVPCNAPPLIYVTRTGKPRIALMGRIPDLGLPVPFTTLDNRLTFATQEKGNVMLFFRDPLRDMPIKVLSRPDIDSIIARLGGMGAEDSETMNFSYGEIAAVLQSLVDNGKLLARGPAGDVLRASFLLQEPPRVRDDLSNASLYASGGLSGGEAPDFGSAVTEKPAPAGKAAPSPANLSPEAHPAPIAMPDGPKPIHSPGGTESAGPDRGPTQGPSAPAAGAAGESNAPKF